MHSPKPTTLKPTCSITPLCHYVQQQHRLGHLMCLRDKVLDQALPPMGANKDENSYFRPRLRGTRKT